VPETRLDRVGFSDALIVDVTIADEFKGVTTRRTCRVNQVPGGEKVRGGEEEGKGEKKAEESSGASEGKGEGRKRRGGNKH
jgi:hypothetical protein